MITGTVSSVVGLVGVVSSVVGLVGVVSPVVGLVGVVSSVVGLVGVVSPVVGLVTGPVVVADPVSAVTIDDVGDAVVAEVRSPELTAEAFAALPLDAS